MMLRDIHSSVFTTMATRVRLLHLMYALLLPFCWLAHLHVAL